MVNDTHTRRRSWALCMLAMLCNRLSVCLSVHLIQAFVSKTVAAHLQNWTLCQSVVVGSSSRYSYNYRWHSSEVILFSAECVCLKTLIFQIRLDCHYLRVLVLVTRVVPDKLSLDGCCIVTRLPYNYLEHMHTMHLVDCVCVSARLITRDVWNRFFLSRFGSLKKLGYGMSLVLYGSKNGSVRRFSRFGLGSFFEKKNLDSE